MRVLVVPKWYPWPDRPVFGAFCREHARALARHHDVVVLASTAVRGPDFAAYQLSDGVEEGIRTLRLPYRRPAFRPASMGIQLTGMLAAMRRLRREGWRPEIVHAHVYSAGLPAVLIGRMSGAPVLITEHFTGFQRGLITGYDLWVARRAFRSADLVAPVSEDLARHVRPLAPATPIRVVGNVVDTQIFHPGPRAPAAAPSRLLTIGTLTAKKGHDLLIDALPQLGDVMLEVVGDGDERARLEARAARRGVAERVRFLGERTREEVAALMRAADLFVLPSRFENLPVVLIEAIASGLPAVATDVGGVSELREGLAGLCPPEDPQALASAIAHALSGIGDWDRDRAAAWAAARFGYEPIAATWSEIYAQLRRSAGTSSSRTRRLTSAGR